MDTNFPSSRLAELRKKHKLTQEKMAEQLGVNKNTLSAVETSRRLLTIDKGIEIAKKFHVSLDWLYGLQDAEKKSDILDNFSSFFNFSKCTIPVEDKTPYGGISFLTMQLSNVVRDYLLEMNEIEKIYNEKNLPEPAYKAWRESVKTQYLERLERQEECEKIEFVLIENDKKLGANVAYGIARRQLPDISAQIEFDKLNSND